MASNKIEKIADCFKTTFQMGWIEQFDWGTEKTSATSMESIIEKISVFNQEVFYLFAQSVLSGEYIVKKNYIKTLNEVYDLLSNGEIFENGKDSYKTNAVTQFNNMTYELGNIIRKYKHLLTYLDNKYREKPEKYIVNAYRIRHESKDCSKFFRLYTILLDITRIDHLLSSDKDTIRKLIIYHTELENGINDNNHSDKIHKVLDIMNEKCLFLLKKLLIEDEKEFDYLIDFEHKHYDTSKLSFVYFAELDKRFEFYRTESYSNSSFGEEIDAKVQQGSLPVGQYSLLMKYYKDSKNTVVTQIENIISDFNKLHSELLKIFTRRPLDHYALGTLKNYMYNSRFSFLMKEDSYSFNQLRKDLTDIQDIQHQTGILNFYPYRKAFAKALELFRKNNQMAKDEMDEYKKFMSSCIEKFSEAIQWCNDSYFYPIQLVYKECLVPIQDFGAVFVASSFCRPVKYEKLRDELNTYKNQILLLENEIALRDERTALTNLKRDIDNSRTREIEILSIFTSIVTFLFGTIGFFSENKNNDFLHLIYSILGLGAVLLIFVSGIHLTTMRKEVKFCDYFKHPRAWFCYITIISSFILLIWMVVNVQTMGG